MTQTLQEVPEAGTIGRSIYELIARLYPICRSITGNGVRETLRIIGERIPLEVHEVPTGTRVFDWTVPKEWNIREAYIADSHGRRLVDFADSSLHVMNYSVPVARRMSLAELTPHLHSLPEHPDWIPYRTSYYREDWAFCLTHRQLLALRDDVYEVRIDSTLESGSLTYGEYFLAGASADEVLISTHLCHPALCNDNLSGIAVVTALAQHLATVPRRYSYRFLFVPGTIGSITWLARNEARVDRVKHGLVVANAGDSGPITYKRSRRGTAEIDVAAAHVLRHAGHPFEVTDFSPYGYDERQFCSPGFNLPVGCFTRTPHGQYEEYHTSADDLGFVQPSALADSFQRCLAILDVLEGNWRFVNLSPKCEPQLGRRGLYRSVGGQKLGGDAELAMLWTLNLSDGAHSLLEIAERANLKFSAIRAAAERLMEHGLLRPTVDGEGAGG
jgi:aminopeptidase-like protein